MEKETSARSKTCQGRGRKKEDVQSIPPMRSCGKVETGLASVEMRKSTGQDEAATYLKKPKLRSELHSRLDAHLLLCRQSTRSKESVTEMARGRCARTGSPSASVEPQKARKRAVSHRCEDLVGTISSKERAYRNSTSRR